MNKFVIREIEKKDDKAVEKIIRDCLIEYGANHEGTAWADENLGRFSEIYGSDGNRYWVAENEEKKVVGGVGIGELKGADGICELQKMYCVPQVRGTGVANELISVALEYAKKYYAKCYLETMTNMYAAHRFYEKHGFARVFKPIIQTEHFACEVKYLKDL